MVKSIHCILYNTANGGVPFFIGDSLCDDRNNHEYCDYDGGDCCGYSVLTTSTCSQCVCHGTVTTTSTTTSTSTMITATSTEGVTENYIIIQSVFILIPLII